MLLNIIVVSLLYEDDPLKAQVIWLNAGFAAIRTRAFTPRTWRAFSIRSHAVPAHDS